MKKENNKSDYESAKEAVHKFIQEHRLQNGLDNIDIHKLWRQELGPVIDKYTSHLSLQKGTLYVELSSAPLRNELSYGKEKILHLLNQAMHREVVKKIVFR